MKIWCISDTHMKHGFLEIPENVDMVIHAGDMGTVRDLYNNEQAIRNGLMWMESLTHIKYKVLIAGNHCTSIEGGLISRGDIEGRGIIYLEHETKEVGGLKIFGSPYTPSFGQGWAFNVKRGKLDSYWSEIQEGTDIVITHGPPLGVLDHTQSGTTINTDPTWGNSAIYSCGCRSLLNHIKRVKPKLHIFGHIHNEERCQNAGIQQIQGCPTKFINASVLDLDYNIDNNGVYIEI